MKLALFTLVSSLMASCALTAQTDIAVQQITPSNKQSRILLGIRTQPLEATKPGLQVVNVLAGSPASSAGIKPGDLLLSFEQQQLYHPWQIVGLSSQCKPGDRVNLTFLRAGKQQTTELTFKQWSNQDTRSANEFDQLPHHIRSQVLQILGKESSSTKLTVSSQSIDLDKGDINVSIDDGQTGSITLKKGKFYLVASDKTGKTIFEGFCDTPAEIALIPTDFQSTIRTLNTLEFKKQILQMHPNH